MNTSAKRLLFGTRFAAVSLITLSTTVWSMGPGTGIERGPGRMVAHIADRLDLSEEQQSEVQKLLSASRNAMAADHQRLKELRQQLRSQWGSFEAGKAQSAADEIGLITSRMVLETASIQAEVYRLLTTEQREQMEGMMEMREERGGKWRREGGQRTQ